MEQSEATPAHEPLIQPAAVDLERLVLLASSAELISHRDEVAGKLSRISKDLDPSGYASVENRLRRAEAQVTLGEVRDELQKERPEECWCLGLGGKVRMWVTHDVYGYETYCTCSDGTATWERVRQEQRRQEHATRMRYVQELFGKARIPARFKSWTLGTYPVTDANRATFERVCWWLYGPARGGAEDQELWDAWSKERKEGLFLFGPYGGGKTGLAVGILHHRILEAQETGLFVTVPTLLDHIRKTYDRKAETTETDLLDLVKGIDCLVLDDLGAERMTEWARERLFVIINHRHNEQLETIFTSNLTLEQLGEDERLGERIVWRIVEQCMVVHVDGPNLRDL